MKHDDSESNASLSADRAGAVLQSASRVRGPAASTGGRWRGILRATAYLGCVGAVATALLVSQARAHAGERLQRAGLDLLSALGPRFVAEPTAVTINEQPMFLSSKLVPDSVSTVLDHFEQYCRGPAPSSPLPAGGGDPSVWLRSRLEEKDGSRGHIACFVPHQKLEGVGDLLERATAFAHSGDLAELGEVRYMVARRHEETKSTHVLTMWTDGSFNVLALLPETGDAPGADSKDVPRPAGSRRLLSAAVPGQPYALRFYDSEQPPAAVLGSYEEGMAEREWQRLSMPVATGGHDMNQNLQLFVRDGRAVIITASEAADGRTSVSLLELEGPGAVRASVELEGDQP